MLTIFMPDTVEEAKEYRGQITDHHGRQMNRRNYSKLSMMIVDDR
jgi:hypothetical protein